MIYLNNNKNDSIKKHKAERFFHGGINSMKIDRHIKILISLVCIGIWLIVGNSAALGASPDPLGLRKNSESR